jgi:hypothetical protein
VSIDNDVFGICKNIWKIEIREQIKSLIKSLSSFKEEELNTNRDRSILAQIASKQNAQFLGYILAHQRREEIEKNINLPVAALLPDEYELLCRAHFIIEYLNNQLVQGLIEDIPNLSGVLNPYCLFSYKEPDFNISELIDVNIFGSIIKSFRTIPPYLTLNKVPLNISTKINEDGYIQGALEFIRRIEERGVHEIPEDFHELRNAKLMNTPERIVQMLFFSVMALRKTICNIDQLIFQAFIKDKLVVLNEENIINIVHNNTHMIGRGLTILIQPTYNEFTAHPGEIILVKFQTKNYKIDKMCFVEGMKSRFLNENGDTIEFNLRVLDDNLNPLFGLFRQ